MKIIVLSGSPAGEQSVTLRYVQYLQKHFPQHQLQVIHAAQRIHALETSPEEFAAVIDEVRSADAVLWAFPLYYCVVCSQYKRFIELIFDRGAQDAFAGKYAATLSTSIHFFDHTAHAYLRAICDDLQMKFAGSYSAAMDDLTQPEERRKLLHFAQTFLSAVERQAPSTRLYLPLVHQPLAYTPGPVGQRVDTQGKRVLILSDTGPGQPNLPAMVEQLRASFSGEAEVINLHDVETKGGCHGCCKCGLDNECVYAGKDGFIDFYNEQVCAADILVFAITIKARHLSATWRRFLDRSFFRGHQPSLSGKQFAFLIEGPLTQLPEMRETLDAYVQVQQCNLVGWISDECETSEGLDALLQDLAGRLVADAVAGYIKPQTFLGVASQKLFRDEVWGRMRLAFQSDHRAYQRLGYYDFPMRDFKTRLRNALLIPLTRIPRLRRELRKHMRDGMTMPYKKVLERD